MDGEIVEEIAEMEVVESLSSPNKSDELVVNEENSHSVLQESGNDFDDYDELDVKYNLESKQPKSYSSTWERNAELQDWISKDPTNASRAICRFCSCTLRAHKTDLKKHMFSNKHKRNKDIFQQNGGIVVTKPTCGIQTIHLKRESPPELDDPSCSIFNDALNAIQNDHSFLTENQDESSVTDGEIKTTVNKVGEAFCRDLLRLLRRQKPLVRDLQRSDFSIGEEGIDRMTKLLVAHLAQHYLVESTLSSWRQGGTMTDHIANKLNVVEDRMEKYVMEIRNMKLQLESESGKGPTGVTLDTLHLSEFQNTSATINIIGS